MRVLVVGLAATGASVVSYTRAAGHEVTVLDDAPGSSDAYAERVARVYETTDAPVAASPTTRTRISRALPGCG